MEIKTEQRIVEYKKYVTKDGMEFDDYESAEEHEALLAGEEIFGLTEKDINGCNPIYVVVHSAKETDAFEDFVKACGFSCFIEDGYENFHYPAVFRFDEDGDFKKVYSEVYERAKRIVSLFETLQSE